MKTAEYDFVAFLIRLLPAETKILHSDQAHFLNLVITFIMSNYLVPRNNLKQINFCHMFILNGR